MGINLGAAGETRTLTPFRARVSKTRMSTIPTQPHCLVETSRIERRATAGLGLQPSGILPYIPLASIFYFECRRGTTPRVTFSAFPRLPLEQPMAGFAPAISRRYQRRSD